MKINIIININININIKIDINSNNYIIRETSTNHPNKVFSKHIQIRVERLATFTKLFKVRGGVRIPAAALSKSCLLIF